jgi:hypothetical protein
MYTVLKDIGLLSLRVIVVIVPAEFSLCQHTVIFILFFPIVQC